jgi:hypothetical protein
MTRSGSVGLRLRYRLPDQVEPGCFVFYFHSYGFLTNSHPTAQPSHGTPTKPPKSVREIGWLTDSAGSFGLAI